METGAQAEKRAVKFCSVDGGLGSTHALDEVGRGTGERLPMVVCEGASPSMSWFWRGVGGETPLQPRIYFPFSLAIKGASTLRKQDFRRPVPASCR